MARIRSIKPEFYRHYDLFLAEKESGLPLRVAFSGLWLCSDKEGRFKWKPIQLKLDVLPYDEVDFLDVLIALKKYGFLTNYEVDGREYGFIPTFKEHQRITGSEATSESKIPCPPICYENGNALETPKKQPGNNLDDKEGKGMGREKEGKGIEQPPVTFDMQKIYLKTWDEYKTVLNGQAKKINEPVFLKWKEFVDFIWNNNYQEIFTAKFVSPIDFGILIAEKGFLQAKWKDVIERMLATGVTPQQNLFFRIPQFINYSNKTDEPYKTAFGSVGKTIEFDKP